MGTLGKKNVFLFILAKARCMNEIVLEWVTFTLKNVEISNFKM